MSNPMEQFTIKPLIPLEYKGIDISFTNSALCMVIAVLASSLILGLCIRKRNIIPTAAQCIPESIYGFINNLIKENVGREGLKYFSFKSFKILFENST